MAMAARSVSPSADRNLLRQIIISLGRSPSRWQLCRCAPRRPSLSPTLPTRWPRTTGGQAAYLPASLREQLCDVHHRKTVLSAHFTHSTHSSHPARPRALFLKLTSRSVHCSTFPHAITTNETCMHVRRACTRKFPPFVPRSPHADFHFVAQSVPPSLPATCAHPHMQTSTSWPSLYPPLSQPPVHIPACRLPLRGSVCPAATSPH